ncbi:Clp protease N-terminal domain-containing protein [Streptomyces sp. URMC 126]|uniref:Clp protease N-terminal domain-containing protein n=1 Tax=Streptomyces sp. URMC 126 TaxID=3423401 RepID=UPI003F1BF89E
MTFERFTVKARKVVVTAQEEARLLKHDHIGTEHLLLALLEVPDHTAANVLHRLGYDKEAARADVVAVVEPGTQALNGHIPFAPSAKRALDLALREAQRLRHTDIGTEHILLALAGEGAGAGAEVLAKRFGSVDRVRAAVLSALEGPQEAVTGPWSAATPAVEDAVSTAGALAGAAPVGSHHLLEAMVRAEDSMAARVLRELGVDPDAVIAKIDELDPETTTDAGPEEAAARKMEIRLVEDEVRLILRDPATVSTVKKIAELAGGGPVRGVGPVAGMFVPVWRSADELLRRLRSALEPEPGGADGSPASDTDRAVRAALGSRLRR